VPVGAILIFMGICWTAGAQTEVTLVPPGEIRSAVEQLIPSFERKTGYKRRIADEFLETSLTAPYDADQPKGRDACRRTLLEGFASG
jgi:hypothetical protein